jgi:hypothetical protein
MDYQILGNGGYKGREIRVGEWLLYCTLLYSTVRCCTVHYYTVLTQFNRGTLNYDYNFCFPAT